MNLSEEELPKALQKHVNEEEINKNSTNNKETKNQKNMVKNINNNYNSRNTRSVYIGLFIIWTIFRL